MNTQLPTTEELERLTLRSVVAYAVRTARRITRGLHGIVADDLIADALKLAQDVSTSNFVGEIDLHAVISAAESVTAAYADAPADLQSLERFRIVFSLAHVAQTAMYAVLAAENAGGARHQMKRAAEEAQRAIHLIEVLSGTARDEAQAAARRDYDVLLREYGEQKEVILGEPVVCFDSE